MSERKPKTSQEAGQLADDYQQARRRTQHGVNGNQPQEIKKEATILKRCHTCNQVGHLARDCPKGNKSVGKMLGKDRPWKTEGDFRCFNCNQKGHTSKNCPSSTLFCGTRIAGGNRAAGVPAIARQGLVEGQKAENILLDTGCARTVVRDVFVHRRRFWREKRPPFVVHMEIQFSIP